MKFIIDARPLLETYPSGVARYTYQLIRHLARRKDEHEYVLFYNAFQKSEKIEAFKKYKNISIRSFHIPNKIFNSAQTIFHFPYLDTLVKGADLFFAPNWGFVQVSGRIPFVGTVHDISYKIYPKFLSPKGRLWHSVIHPTGFFQKADRIIAVSEHTKNDLAETFHIPKERISVVPCGADHDSTFEEEDTNREIENNLPKRYILSLGTIEPRKNIHGLIRAFVRLKEFPIIQSSWHDLALVIVGASGFKSEILKKTARADIIFLDYLSESEGIALYKKAIMLAYPSFYEGFGFPPLEAAKQGTPSLVSNVAALPEIMQDGALYVDPYNKEDMARAMFLLVTNKRLRERIQQKARERAKVFRWSDAAAQTVAVWEQVVKERKRSRLVSNT